MSSLPAHDSSDLADIQFPAASGCSLAGPPDALLCDMELPWCERFYPLGYPIDIVTNAPEVLAIARETFGHSRAARASEPLRVHVGVSPGGERSRLPEPTRREFNHLYSLVADAPNQALLDLKTGTSFIWMTQAAISDGIYFRYNFLEKAVYLQLGAFLVTDIHAACVSRNGRGFLLCGASGAGKTTLAYACATNGWTYTSDDTSYLISESNPPRVIGHSHRIRFRPAAALLFPEVALHPRMPRMEGKASIEIQLAELPQLSTATETTVDSIICLNRYPGATGHIERLAPGAATMRMRDELYSAGEIRAGHVLALEKLWNVPTFRLDYCDLTEAVELLDLLARDV